MSTTGDGPPSPRYALMAARPPRGALQPSNSNALNTQLGLEGRGKKRKRESESVQGEPRSPFVARLYKSHLSDKPLTFNPVTTILRAQLPLAWLDPAPSTAAVTPGQLFYADIKAFSKSTVQNDRPLVLTARVAPNGGLYAIEEVEHGLYAACKLASWVKERDLIAIADGTAEPAITHPALMTTSGCKEARNISKDQDLPAEVKTQKPKLKKGVLARMSILPPKAERNAVSPQDEYSITSGLRSGDIDPGDPSIKPEEAESPNILAVAEFVALPNSQTEPTLPAQVKGLNNEPTEAPSLEPQEVFDTLRSQYMEALYVSKASVAYFAKGPLTRARNSLQSNGDIESQPLGLATFYRDSIMSLKKVDTKYRESIAKVVQTLPFVPESGDEGAQRATPPSAKKKPRTKKRKMAKNGLYPNEETYIAKWWKTRTYDTTLLSSDSMETEIKRILPDLRSRETYLQILLILEAMSLESTQYAKPPAYVDSSLVGKEASHSSATKKAIDLTTHLELLLDRLCIWHTVDSEIVSSGQEKPPAKDSKSGKATSDKLRDFCVEVIVPFYASRLPEQCKAINRKLGGPSIISPKRARAPLAKSASMSHVPPNGPTKQSQSHKAKRSLQRVLTDEKMATHSRAPSLSRSTTAPVLPELKRESSEPSVASLRPGSRGGIQKPKRLDNREVDLNAVAKQHEAKLKRMRSLVEQKKELDDAINALRKPNRSLVAKDLAESAEQRAEAGSKSARKSKNPIRIPASQGVQVMATPKKGRSRLMLGNLPLTRMEEIDEGPETEVQEPPSSETHIPSSTVKPSTSIQDSSRKPSAPAAFKQSLFAVHETPSRGSSKLSNPLNLDLEAAHDSGIGSSSPLTLPPRPPAPEALAAAATAVSASHAVESTPTAQRSYLLPDVQSTPRRMTKSQKQVLLTPIRRHEASRSDIFAGAPVPNVTGATTATAEGGDGGGGKEQDLEKSIYESLGWDDDDADVDV